MAIDGTLHSINPTSQVFAESGGSGSVTITTSNGCNWAAASQVAWITFSPNSSGSGNGTVNFIVSANPSSSMRTGTLTVAGQTFTVTQAVQACNYAITPTTQTFSASANTGNVNVTTGSGCAWTATSNASFITITSGASGSGPGTVNYAVAANATPGQRTGTLTIAGQTFTVTQAGGTGSCNFTLTPANQVIATSGGSGSFNVATQAGCNWSAATNNNWIVIAPGSTGSGNGRVDFTVAANASTIPRAGTITVAGQTFLVGQNGTGATCRLSPISLGQAVNGELTTTDCGSPVYGAEFYADLFYFSLRLRAHAGAPALRRAG